MGSWGGQDRWQCLVTKDKAGVLKEMGGKAKVMIRKGLPTEIFGVG